MEPADAFAILAGVVAGAGFLAALARPAELSLVRLGLREAVSAARLSSMLRAAGIDMPPALFLQFAALWAAGGFLLGMILQLGLPSAVMLALFGASFYYVRAREQAAARRLRLAGEMLVFLQSMSAGLRAGLPRSEAIARAKAICGPEARRAIEDLEARLAMAGDSPQARDQALWAWAADLNHPVVTAAAQIFSTLLIGGGGIAEMVEVISTEMGRLRRILETARARGRGMQRQIYGIIAISAAGLVVMTAGMPEAQQLLLGNPLAPLMVVGGWFGALLVSEFIMDRYFSMEETVGVARGGAGLIPMDRYGNPILPEG